jgi:sec-independent protein translocase protein TatB
MFGLGWGEMVVIGIVALIAIGPKELPTVLRTLGQAMTKIRRMANEFQGQFQEALREAELTDLKKHADDIATDMSKMSNFDPMADTQKEMARAFEIPDPTATPAAETAGVASATEPVPDGAKLPAAAIPPVIDVPLPDLPPPVTEKDFAPAEPPPQEAKKQAGGSA